MSPTDRIAAARKALEAIRKDLAATSPTTIVFDTLALLSASLWVGFIVFILARFAAGY